jgi:drug/metabolite transporter (DMT)-like permease
MVLASLCFALTGAIARIYREDYTSVQLVFFRNIAGVVFIIYSLWSMRPVQKGGRPLLLFFRGLVGTLAFFCFFYGVETMGLAQAIIYQQSYPIFLALISVLILKQSITKLGWVAIVFGWIGLCLVFFPKITDSHMSLTSNLVGISNLFLTGMAYLSIRGLAEYYDKRVIVLSFMLCGIVMPLISFCIAQVYSPQYLKFIIADFKPLQYAHIPIFIVFGLIALAGQYFLTLAFTHKNTGMVGAMGFSNVIFSILFGVLIGDGMPDFIGCVGMGLILASGITLTLQKST